MKSMDLCEHQSECYDDEMEDSHDEDTAALETSECTEVLTQAMAEMDSE